MLTSTKALEGYDADYLIEQANALSKLFFSKARGHFTYFCRYEASESIHTRERKILANHQLSVNFYFSRYNLSYFILMSQGLNLLLSSKQGLIDVQYENSKILNQTGDGKLLFVLNRFNELNVFARNAQHLVEANHYFTQDINSIKHCLGIDDLSIGKIPTKWDSQFAQMEQAFQRLDSVSMDVSSQASHCVRSAQSNFGLNYYIEQLKK